MPGSEWTPTRYVANIEEAKAAPVPYGQRQLMMMDSALDRFYVKTLSDNGFVSFKVFEFKEVEPPKPPEYATKDDLQQIKEMLNELIASNATAATAQSVPDFIAAQNAARADDPAAGTAAGESAH